jgi:hypothetical protein
VKLLDFRKNFITLTFLMMRIPILCPERIPVHLYRKEYGMFRRCGLPLLALVTPLTLVAKGKGDGLTQKEIVDVIQSHSDDARACYQEAVDKDSTAEGKVKIRFLIGLKGKIEASEVEQNTFKDKSIGKCLRNKMNAWTFPKPRGGQKISIAYPFEFKKAPPPPPPAPEAPPAPTAPGTPDTPSTAPATPPTPPSPETPQSQSDG